MIIYGWNSRVLKQAPFPGHTCTNCGQQDSHVVVSGSYGHIFWIPLFPYKKALRIICAHCQHQEKPKTVSEEVHQFAKKLKSTVKFPIWMFAGSGIVAAIIIYGVISNFLAGQRDLNLLDDPQVNDIYYLYNKEESTDYKFSLNKVIAVNGDSVNVSPNSFIYNFKPSMLEREDGFYDIYYTYHKNELRQMYKDDVIREVKRGFLPGRGFERELVYPDSLLLGR